MLKSLYKVFSPHSIRTLSLNLPTELNESDRVKIVGNLSESEILSKFVSEITPFTDVSITIFMNKLDAKLKNASEDTMM